MKQWYCRWCGKKRTKKPTKEQRSIVTEEWMPLCSYCERSRSNQANTNPFWGLIQIEIRDIQIVENDKDDAKR